MCGGSVLHVATAKEGEKGDSGLEDCCFQQIPPGTLRRQREGGEGGGEGWNKPPLLSVFRDSMNAMILRFVQMNMVVCLGVSRSI